jgi:hypothetical protein
MMWIPCNQTVYAFVYVSISPLDLSSIQVTTVINIDLVPLEIIVSSKQVICREKYKITKKRTEIIKVCGV